ncbi:MAG: hydroxyacid dehydrogenase [Anaerolineales bacterium]|nr:hydroxyacid dehydrogenase [Anaerolineales bacterium]
MAIPQRTQVWLEAPLFDATAALLPATVEVLHALPATPIYANATGAQAIIASSLLRYDGAVMDACPDLRLIARVGIGVDNVDLPAATARGIVVTNTPDGPTESTAEHTVAMLLALAKRLKQGNANFAEGRWGPRNGILMGDEVLGKTLGLVGLGRIGRRVGQICRLGFEMQVLAYDPYVTQEQAAAQGIELASLDRVIAEADFLSLHAPALAETYKLMDERRIRQMKRGSYLLNMARGTLVDQEALLAALDDGHLLGAGLDVFDPEPPPVSLRLRDHPNVVATPHMASVTFEGRTRMETMAVERVLTFLRGERPADVVNHEVWDHRKA